MDSLDLKKILSKINIKDVKVIKSHSFADINLYNDIL